MTNIQNRIYFWASISPLIASLIFSLIILIFFKFLPTKLPLFYSLSWGNQQLATHNQFLIIPGTLTAVTLLNLGISRQLHPQQKFFKKILLLNPLIINLILIVTFIKIILIFI